VPSAHLSALDTQTKLRQGAIEHYANKDFKQQFLQKIKILNLKAKILFYIIPLVIFCLNMTLLHKLAKFFCRRKTVC